MVCGKPLACGNHVCEEFCHLGKCKACRIVLHEPLTCACGESRIDPPVVCGTALPVCDMPCGKLRECGHRCQATCHAGDCPLCCELVSRRCLGGHQDVQNQFCHVGAISCGQLCGRRLPCGHSCGAMCHAGDCPPCTLPCGKPREHCGHTCEAPCHPGSACPDVPCRRKVRFACGCGLRVEDQICAAYSGARQRTQLASLRCNQGCELVPLTLEKGAELAQRGRSEKYTLDFHQVALQHKAYVLMIEAKFRQVVATKERQVLPLCDPGRRHLAAEYARLHWGLRAACKKDELDGWWLVKIEWAPECGVSHPLLSDPKKSDSAFLGPALTVQPQLHFFGVKGAGDEVYGLCGYEGLLGVRPVVEAELAAFFSDGAVAKKTFQRLTGRKEPEAEPSAVTARVTVASGAGLSSGGGSAWAGGRPGGAAASGAAAAAPSGGAGLRVAFRSLGTGSAASAGGRMPSPTPPDDEKKKAPPTIPVAKVADPPPDTWEDEDESP